jgi:hypothetical protein
MSGAERDESVDIERITAVANRGKVVNLQPRGGTAHEALVAVTPASERACPLPRT